VTFEPLRIAALNFVLLALLFAPLERLFPARLQPSWRRESWLDASFFLGQYLLFAGLAVLVMASVRSWLVAAEPPALRMWLASLPPVLVAAGAVVAGDVLVYWFHRACHSCELLWRFHAVHHSSEELDWLAAHREHPLDGLITQLCQNLPAIALGVHYELLAGLVVFRGAWAVFIHSNVDLPLGPVGLLIGAPELHRFHHARVRETRHNFANLAPWLDVVFGTYCRPAPRAEFALGLTEPLRRGYVGHLVRPLVPTFIRPDPRENAGL
jgi:sterol desaturase/sphingolipid hydroxylase (fatty acid hydroxylase superfamily)